MRQVIQPPPNQIWPAAKINHTSRQTFIHRHIRLTAGASVSRFLRCGSAARAASSVFERILRIKSSPVPPYPFFLSQRLKKRLAQGYPTILNRMMRVDLQIPFATQLQIDDPMLCEQRQHVIEKWNP